MVVFNRNRPAPRHIEFPAAQVAVAILRRVHRGPLMGSHSVVFVEMPGTPQLWIRGVLGAFLSV
jgi:hypothetical protein